jgi:hypothetical protein
MSTHGCLVVSDWHRRQVTLHTHHSGYAIPELPPLVFGVLAKYYSHILSLGTANVAKFIDGANVLERLEYANSAASLLIAARPCFLELVTPGSRKDLPDWSGIDKPYRLKIRKDGLWDMQGQDGSLITRYDTRAEMISRLSQEGNKSCS